MNWIPAGLEFPLGEMAIGADYVLPREHALPKAERPSFALQQIGQLLFLLGALAFCTMGGAGLIQKLLLFLVQIPEL